MLNSFAPSKSCPIFFMYCKVDFIMYLKRYKFKSLEQVLK